MTEVVGVLCPIFNISKLKAIVYVELCIWSIKILFHWLYYFIIVT